MQPAELVWCQWFRHAGWSRFALHVVLHLWSAFMRGQPSRELVPFGFRVTRSYHDEDMCVSRVWIDRLSCVDDPTEDRELEGHVGFGRIVPLVEGGR